jgi:hypothetical protein
MNDVELPNRYSGFSINMYAVALFVLKAGMGYSGSLSTTMHSGMSATFVAGTIEEERDVSLNMVTGDHGRLPNS